MSTPTSNTNGVRTLLKFILTVDLVLAALVATVNSLALYMGGDALGASAPATVSAAVLGWILNFLFISVAQGFFLTILGFIAAFGIGFVLKTADEKQVKDGQAPGIAGQKTDNALWRLLKWAIGVDLVLALLVAAYNAVVTYGLFSVLHADPALNLVTSILTGVLTFAYATIGIAFFGAILAGICLAGYFVATGGMSRKTEDATTK